MNYWQIFFIYTATELWKIILIKLMNIYFAFLRGINVGGYNVIKMQDLRDLFLSMGYKGVKTYIQSGNVKFETSEPDIALLKEKLEKQLDKKFNYKSCVILRSFEDLTGIYKLKIFEKHEQESGIKLYVCFSEKNIKPGIKLPLKIEKEGLEIIKIINNNIFILSYPVKDRYGFPNNFVEKEFSVLSTARNWNTVCKMIND